jgi:hypothetical protein
MMLKYAVQELLRVSAAAIGVFYTNIFPTKINYFYQHEAKLPEVFNSEKHFSCASPTKGFHSSVLFADIIELVTFSLLMVPSSSAQPFFLAMHSMKH